MKLIGKLLDDYLLARAMSGFGGSSNGGEGRQYEVSIGKTHSVTDATHTNLYTVSIVGDAVTGEILLENWNLVEGEVGKAPGSLLGRLSILPEAVPSLVKGIHQAREMVRDLRYGLLIHDLPCRVVVVEQAELLDEDIELRLGREDGEPKLLLRKLARPLGLDESVDMDMTTAAEVATLLLLGLDAFPEDWENWAAAHDSNDVGSTDS